MLRESRIYKADLAHNLRNPTDQRNTLQDEYLAQLRARVLEREQGLDPRDLPFHMQRLGVPSDAILALRQPADEPAMRAATTFNRAPRGLTSFLFLSGPTGVGKTTAAAAVVQECLRRHPPNGGPTGQLPPVVWLHASALTRLSQFDSERDMRAWRAAHLLVLDDAGEEASELGRAAVIELVKEREASGRRTVITTNLRPADFGARYGSAVTSRLEAKGVNPNLWNVRVLRRKTGAPRAQEAV
ncbi:MAG TPA: hypothetical protein VMY76_00780 [Gemmatimonadales bacterium]|nr:hypothetical protein [Gemmatimonadales bacterium]